MLGGTRKLRGHRPWHWGQALGVWALPLLAETYFPLSLEPEPEEGHASPVLALGLSLHISYVNPRLNEPDSNLHSIIY